MLYTILEVILSQFLIPFIFSVFQVIPSLQRLGIGRKIVNRITRYLCTSNMHLIFELLFSIMPYTGLYVPHYLLHRLIAFTNIFYLMLGISSWWNLQISLIASSISFATKGFKLACI